MGFKCKYCEVVLKTNDLRVIHENQPKFRHCQWLLRSSGFEILAKPLRRFK